MLKKIIKRQDQLKNDLRLLGWSSADGMRYTKTVEHVVPDDYVGTVCHVQTAVVTFPARNTDGIELHDVCVEYKGTKWAMFYHVHHNWQGSFVHPSHWGDYYQHYVPWLRDDCNELLKRWGALLPWVEEDYA